MLVEAKGRVKIKHVSIGDNVWTRKGWIKVVNTFENGMKEIYEVETLKGYKIQTSNDHIFFDGESNEKKLKDFNVGDEVSMLLPKENIKIPNINLDMNFDGYKIKRIAEKTKFDKKLNEDLILDSNFAYFLGFSYGDGYVGKDKYGEPCVLSLAVEHLRPEIENKICAILDSLDIKYNISKGDGAVSDIQIHNKKLVYILQNNALLKEKSGDINFPNKIKNSSTEIIGAFISGYYDADGTFPNKKRGYKLSSIRKEFLLDVQTEFLNVGVVSTLMVEDRQDKGWNDLYSLTVAGTTSHTNIREFLSESLKIQYNMHISKRDKVKTSYTANELGFKSGKYVFVEDNHIKLSLSAFNRLDDIDKNECEMMFIDNIKSITKIKDSNTFDLQLDSVHSFFAQGFQVHNSGRRGALMVSINVNHPDAESFITMKHNKTRVTGANISVQISNEFMEAVESDSDFIQKFPVDHKFSKSQMLELEGIEDYGELVKLSGGILVKKIKAKKLWEVLVNSATKTAEPGILFWDEITKMLPAHEYE